MNICPNCNAQNRDAAQFCRQCGTQLSRRTRIGSTLGGEYRVVEIVKAGGMGTVYRAESDGEFYAVKEMRDSFTDPQERQDAINRFMAEALMLARLSHPHIPQVHRHFIEGDRYFLVMDFVEGEDLQVVLDREGNPGLPEEQVLNWALQICSVLEYLHGQTPPVIFRDLKPSNIILKPSGDIALIDFGIAKLFNPARQGTLIGTPGYAAPEQYQGLTEPRSDIFGLGATLHHLLTGRDPRQHPPFNFPLAMSVNSAVTTEMDNIVQKALEMSSNDRWASVQEIRQTLVSLAGPVKLEPGMVLAGRYRITNRGRVGRMKWVVATFKARNLQTGAKCWIIPIGDDPVEAQIMQRLAGLRCQALPRMEIVTHRGTTCFINHAVEGIPLDSLVIQSPTELISIGLQLCDILEATGTRGAGLSWVCLRPSHVLLNSQGQLSIDGFNYCLDRLSDRRLDKFGPARLVPQYLSTQWRCGAQENVEAAEVEIVGTAVAFPIVSERHNTLVAIELNDRPLALREKLSGIPPYLEQAILGATARGFIMEMPWIRSLAEIRQHLLGQAEGPAHATVSTPVIDFGDVPRGKKPTTSLQLSSRTLGLLYGEIQCETQGLNVGPQSFVKAHPTQIEIEITWDTTQAKDETLSSEVVIETGVETFRTAVRGKVQS